MTSVYAEILRTQIMSQFGYSFLTFHNFRNLYLCDLHESDNLDFFCNTR